MEDGSDTISTLCSCVVNAPILHVMCLFSEIEMFVEWFP